MIHRHRRRFVRALFALLAWSVLSGGTVIKCSSDPGGIGDDNERPEAEDSTFAVSADTVFIAALQASDPDGDALRFEIVSQPALGSVVLVDDRTGRFRYTAVSAGLDSFEFVADDGSAVSRVATVAVQVAIAEATL